MTAAGAPVERVDTGVAVQLPAGEMYRRGRRIQELAQIVMDCTVDGGRRDASRAARVLAQIGAIAGPGGEA